MVGLEFPKIENTDEGCRSPHIRSVQMGGLTSFVANKTNFTIARKPLVCDKIYIG